MNEKEWLQERSSALPPHNFFLFILILLVSNQYSFSHSIWNQFTLLRFWKKPEITHAKAPHAISAFSKTHSCKLIPHRLQNHMITYTNTLKVWENLKRLGMPRVGVFCTRRLWKSTQLLVAYTDILILLARQFRQPLAVRRPFLEIILSSTS